jgi:hypothetical protein
VVRTQGILGRDDEVDSLHVDKQVALKNEFALLVLLGSLMGELLYQRNFL